jgi:hypothetical protein
VLSIDRMWGRVSLCRVCLGVGVGAGGANLHLCQVYLASVSGLFCGWRWVQKESEP